MVSCTKRSGDDEDEVVPTPEEQAAAVANSESSDPGSSSSENSEAGSSSSENPQQGNSSSDDSKGGNGSSGGAGTAQKIDQTVADSEDAKYFALDKSHSTTSVMYSDLSSGGGICELDGYCEKYNYYCAAINTTDYKNGLMAGAYLKVTGPKGTIGVIVVNTVPGESGVLSLDRTALEKIADINDIGSVSWKVAALPNNDPVQFKYKEGSSEYWCDIQVRNHRYPVKKLEVKINGEYVELEKQNNNYFRAEHGLGEGSYTIRLTDIYGHVIEEVVPLKLGEIVTGKNNFKD